MYTYIYIYIFVVLSSSGICRRYIIKEPCLRDDSSSKIINFLFLFFVV